MKAWWRKYTAKVDAMTQRERLMILGASVLLAIAVVYFVMIDPAQRRSRMLLAEMESQRTELVTIEKGGPAQADPNAANRARADALQKQIAAAESTLKAMQRDLVPADRVNALMQEMLARDKGLALVSLRTLPAEPLVPNAEKSGDPKAPPGAVKADPDRAHVYKHGVEITVQGGYSSLHDYLTRLEQVPTRMYWWRARLNADEDTRLTLTVTVYTLSLDKAWLQV